MSAAARTPYLPYGTATYRRVLDVRVTADRAVGELIDDFHHFRATLDLDGRRIVRARGEAVRYPWQTCPGAAVPLRALEGMEVAPSLTAVTRRTASKLQCTHLFDAASFAVAGAARGPGGRRYEIAIPDRIDDCTDATLARDGEPVLAWTMRGSAVESPPPFAGRKLFGDGFAAWAEDTLDPDLAEATLLFQRALVISMGRAYDAEAAVDAADLPTIPMGACHTYQDGTVEHGLRVPGTVRNWSDADEIAAEVSRATPPELAALAHPSTP